MSPLNPPAYYLNEWASHNQARYESCSNPKPLRLDRHRLEKAEAGQIGGHYSLHPFKLNVGSWILGGRDDQPGWKEWNNEARLLCDQTRDIGLLTHPNVPKPLHGLAPRTVKGQVWWDMTRQNALARSLYHCDACGLHQIEVRSFQVGGKNGLEGHEVYEIDYASGRMTYVKTVALCHYCHLFIHSGLMEALVEKGEMKEDLWRQIRTRGVDLLGKEGLKPWRPTKQKSVASWGQWRLVIEGEEHEGKFKNFDEWYEHYHG